MNNALGPALKLYPELSIASLKGKQDKELFMWYELRVLNQNGCGHMALQDALDGLVSVFGYSKTTAKRIIEAGRSYFWGIDEFYDSDGLLRGSRIRIYGLEKVSGYFGISQLSSPVQVSAQQLNKGKRQLRRAWLYASLFGAKGRRSHPIWRGTIQAITGLDRRQQKRYERVAGIRRIPNYGFHQDAEGKLIPLKMEVDSKSKRTTKDRRLSNSYQSQATQGYRGMSKKIDTLLRQESLSGQALPPQRYFLTAVSLLGAVRKGTKDEEAFLLVRRTNRVIPGRREWCLA